MSHIITLIANPADPAVDAALAMRVAAATGCLDIRRLAEGVAVDLVVDHPPETGVIAALVGDRPVDMVVQPADPHLRRKRVLLADMDSTMIRQECIDELAAEAGIKDQVATITARAMNGEIEFEGALRERVALLKGLPVTVIDHVIATRIELMPGGPELVRTMRKHGAWCALVSGGFTDFTGRIAEVLGFNEHRANRLGQADGRLTGTVAEPILGKQAKADALADICARLDLPHAAVIAVGDGANDLAMLDMAGAGVALHAKPSVAAQAKMRIDHGDLTALLYIQGYTDAEIVR